MVTSGDMFRNKECLAPMVRAGTLPLRSLALQYGADLVWGEEVIDRRIVDTSRRENPATGCIEYVMPNNRTVVFSTCENERGRVIFQMGTADPVRAVAAAQHVCQDVAAIDINMGCPKRFSIQGGMGAALLKDPEKAADIVSSLRRGTDLPVTVKMRLLGNPQESVEFARRMQQAGAVALTVHCRGVEDTPSGRARWEELRAIVDALDIPVIANGDIYTREHMRQVKEATGCSSVMLARPALYNCSVFKKDGVLLPLRQVVHDYLRHCWRCGVAYQNAKYTVMEMMTLRRHPDHLQASLGPLDLSGCPSMLEVSRTKSVEALMSAWGLTPPAPTIGTPDTANCSGGLPPLLPAEPSHIYDDSYFFTGASVVAEPAAGPGSQVACPVPTTMERTIPACPDVLGEREMECPSPMALRCLAKSADAQPLGVPPYKRLCAGIDGREREQSGAPVVGMVAAAGKGFDAL